MKISKHNLKSPRYCKGYNSIFKSSSPHETYVECADILKEKELHCPKTPNDCHLVANISTVSILP